MADFPPGSLALKEDSKFRTESQMDPAIRYETDGGYTLTRPRFTRRPPRVFTTGFTNLTETEKNELQSFYDARNGGAQSFTWLDRVSNITYVVRFGNELKFQYAGIGGNHRWNSTEIVLEQV